MIIVLYAEGPLGADRHCVSNMPDNIWKLIEQLIACRLRLTGGWLESGKIKLCIFVSGRGRAAARELAAAW
jgi:hypothetical protein